MLTPYRRCCAVKVDGVDTKNVLDLPLPVLNPQRSSLNDVLLLTELTNGTFLIVFRTLRYGTVGLVVVV